MSGGSAYLSTSRSYLSGTRGSASGDVDKTIGTLVKEFLHKVCQLVVDSRRVSALSEKDMGKSWLDVKPTPTSHWFRLDSVDSPEVRNSFFTGCVRDWDARKDSLDVFIDISLSAETLKRHVLLERWYLKFKFDKSGGLSEGTVHSDVHAIYKRMTVQIRSLLCLLKLLPSQQLVRSMEESVRRLDGLSLRSPPLPSAFPSSLSAGPSSVERPARSESPALIPHPSPPTASDDRLRSLSSRSTKSIPSDVHSEPSLMPTTSSSMRSRGSSFLSALSNTTANVLGSVASTVSSAAGISSGGSTTTTNSGSVSTTTTTTVKKKRDQSLQSARKRGKSSDSDRTLLHSREEVRIMQAERQRHSNHRHSKKKRRVISRDRGGASTPPAFVLNPLIYGDASESSLSWDEDSMSHCFPPVITKLGRIRCSVLYRKNTLSDFQYLIRGVNQPLERALVISEPAHFDKRSSHYHSHHGSRTGTDTSVDATVSMDDRLLLDQHNHHDDDDDNRDRHSSRSDDVLDSEDGDDYDDFDRLSDQSDGSMPLSGHHRRRRKDFHRRDDGVQVFKLDSRSDDSSHHRRRRQRFTVSAAAAVASGSSAAIDARSSIEPASGLNSDSPFTLLPIDKPSVFDDSMVDLRLEDGSDEGVTSDLTSRMVQENRSESSSAMAIKTMASEAAASSSSYSHSHSDLHSSAPNATTNVDHTTSLPPMMPTLDSTVSSDAGRAERVRVISDRMKTTSQGRGSKKKRTRVMGSAAAAPSSALSSSIRSSSGGDSSEGTMRMMIVERDHDTTPPPPMLDLASSAMFSVSMKPQRINSSVSHSNSSKTEADNTLASPMMSDSCFILSKALPNMVPVLNMNSNDSSLRESRKRLDDAGSISADGDVESAERRRSEEFRELRMQASSMFSRVSEVGHKSDDDHNDHNDQMQEQKKHSDGSTITLAPPMLSMMDTSSFQQHSSMLATHSSLSGILGSSKVECKDGSSMKEERMIPDKEEDLSDLTDGLFEEVYDERDERLYLSHCAQFMDHLRSMPSRIDSFAPLVDSSFRPVLEAVRDQSPFLEQVERNPSLFLAALSIQFENQNELLNDSMKRAKKLCLESEKLVKRFGLNE